MEDIVVQALAHVRGQVDNPNEFFEAVHQVHEETREEGFDAFRSAFESRGFGVAGEEFLRFAADNGGSDVLDPMVQERHEELAAAYEAQEDEDSGEGEQEPDPAAEAAWQAMLAEYSTQWDGAEENWDAFQQYVLYYAEERGLTAPATTFFERAASEDKIALFAEYGVTVTPAAAEEAADDSSMWDAAVAAFGDGWAGWDGSEEGWAQYRDWFYTAANSQDAAMYAAAYERMDPMNALDLGERVTQLRELGFDVSGADAAPGEGTEADAAAIEAADEQLAEQAVEKIFEPAMAEFEQRLPDLAAELGMSVDELRAEMAELPEDFFGNLFVEEVAS